MMRIRGGGARRVSQETDDCRRAQARHAGGHPRGSVDGDHTVRSCLTTPTSPLTVPQETDVAGGGTRRARGASSAQGRDG